MDMNVLKKILKEVVAAVLIIALAFGIELIGFNYRTFVKGETATGRRSAGRTGSCGKKVLLGSSAFDRANLHKENAGDFKHPGKNRLFLLCQV